MKSEINFIFNFFWQSVLVKTTMRKQQINHKNYGIPKQRNNSKFIRNGF